MFTLRLDVLVDPGDDHVGELKIVAILHQHGDVRGLSVPRHGREVWLEASYNPVLDANEKLYKVVKFATVITDQVNQERAVAEAANIAYSTSLQTDSTAQRGTRVVTEAVNVMRDLSSHMGLRAITVRSARSTG